MHLKTLGQGLLATMLWIPTGLASQRISVELETVHVDRDPLFRSASAPGMAVLSFEILGANRGVLEIGGRRTSIALVRKHMSPTFSVNAGTLLGLDLDGNGSLRRTTALDPDGRLGIGEMVNADEPFLIDGKPYRAVHISLDGRRLEIEATPDEPAVAQGFTMPDLPIDYLDETKGRLSDLRGKVVVLNHWFTTCSPCIAEMPGMNELVEEYSDREDVVFLAYANNDAATVATFLESNKFLYRHALSDARVLKTLGQFFPLHLIIRPDGRIAVHVTGGSAAVHEVLRAGLESVLAAD